MLILRAEKSFDFENLSSMHCAPKKEPSQQATSTLEHQALSAPLGTACQQWQHSKEQRKSQ